MTQARQGHVLQDCLLEDQSVTLSIFRNKTDALFNSVVWVLNLNQLSINQDFGRLAARMRSKDCHQQFASTGAHQAGDPEDFALTRRKPDVMDQELPRNSWISNRNVPRFKNRRAKRMFGFGKDLAHLTSDHLCDHAGFVEICRFVRTNRPSVSQHGNSTADAKYFF